ncbi:MAG: T9SS type A sorting domain-containing protein [Chitinophagales bacterium]|nr:T9SS type A sorting domain-containing protein [Chitinophagales bacterium]
MKNLFITALLLVVGVLGLQAQVTYEDFEGGPDLAWNGLNGTYNGAVANPDPTGANTSSSVGSYTNAPAFDFCFALYTFPNTLDISEFNQFKMKIWSPTAPAKALLKLEGPGGPAAEKIIDITEANKWVEYTFDLSAGAGYTNLKTILVSFNSFVLGDDKTYYFDDIRAEKAEVCHETFEPAAAANWTGLNGAFNGAIANPGPDALNNSATVGSFTNNPAFDYNFAFGTLAAPLDLSVYNQFHVNVWVPAATKVLFKLEGTGQALEKTKYVAVGGAWQTLSFDMSGASGFTTLNKILIVFNPGQTGDDKTYYFDNICATPNACSGATPDADIIDDYECNRNAAYTGDWTFFSVVSNPAVTGDNNSPKVGRFDDPNGPGTEWSNLSIAYADPIDLSTRNQFSCQVWSAKAGKLLMKLEGGPNPAKEVFVDMTELNKWVTYTANFSDQAGKGHKKLVLFFNAGVNGEPGDVYFVDNIKMSAPTAAPPLEDFQDGIHLGWQALEQNEPIHGVFQGPVANPNPNSVNNSTQVGCYAKGTSPFSTLQGISLTNLDLSIYGQFNLDVLSPAGGGTVTLILNSATEGNKEAEAEITTPGQWETLSFDFSAFSGITDFGEVRIIFNAGTAAPGQIWYFDNLGQTEVTIDPCAGVVPIPNIIDDYECQRNYTQIFYGAGDIAVVNNPHLAPENGSLKVGEYKDPAGAGTEYAGIGIEFPAPPDLSVYNHLSMLVWSPQANVPFLFKLEGGGPAVEVFDTVPEANKWYKFDIDFSGAVGTANTKLVIFANVASAVGGGTYYYDNIRWARAGYNGCIVDHQSVPTTLTFKYFANGHLESEGYQFEVIDNPNPSGINTSSKVGKFVKASDGAPFAGMYSNPDLESPIDWKGVKTVKAKVHMDHIGNFAVKVEGSATGAPAFEIPVANTKTNEWEELTFDFSVVPDNGEYRRLTLFFDLGIDATGTDVTSYFDDIVIGNGNCGSVGTFSPADVASMRISPNPTSEWLLVENMDGVSRLEVFDMYGRRVSVANNSGDSYTDLNVSQFPSGMYLMNGFDRSGALISKAKFVKK